MEEGKVPSIKIENLNVIYNQGKSNEVRSLENINLEIYPQEYVIIFGPSGCGKSTLLYSISGLQRPTSGTVIVKDQDINSLNKRQSAEYHRNTIGMIFQAFYLIPSLSIVDNVCLPKLLGGEDVEKRRSLAAKLLERFNIAEQAYKFPSELSGGQKQRVSIARSLINNPDIILADEPVGNLDSKSSHNVMSILQELNQIDKKTIVLVTHDPSHLSYGDRVVHMKDGKVIKIEVVERKKLPEAAAEGEGGVGSESFIFKDGKIRGDLAKSGLIKGEIVPADLKLLMRAFKKLSLSQIGSLLVPFKVEQLFYHLFFKMTDEQIDMAKKKLQDYLYARKSFEDFEQELDDDLGKGGAGWDRRNAQTFAEKVRSILTQANKIDFTNLEKTALDLSEYIVATLHLNLDSTKKENLTGMILDRLKNRISVEEFKKLVDLSEEKGGLGFNRKTAYRIAREIEILLLLRYSA